jgi:tetratricopeptide (TPR) repeat protein
LATPDPENARWQEDIALVYDRLGFTFSAAGRAADSIEAYRKCFSIREKLAAVSPTDETLQSNLARVLYNLAHAGDDAIARLERARDIYQGLKARDVLDEEGRELLGTVIELLASKHVARGREHLYAARYPEAIASMRTAREVAPADGYAAIWLQMAHLRAGDRDRAALAREADGVDAKRWPRAVVDLFLGRVGPDAVFADAAKADDQITRDGQVCEANFYVGVYEAETGALSEARRLFESATTRCPHDFIEYVAANQELQRLRKSEVSRTAP